MVEDFLYYLSHEKFYSSHTVVSYENDLRAFEAYLLQKEGRLGLGDADADFVRGWAMDLVASGMKVASVNRKLSALRTFYRYLLRKGEIRVSPMQHVNSPKKTKPLPQFVREVDMERMLRATAQGETWREVREHVVLQLFYETGIRLSELVGLNEEDVDFSRKTIKVTGKRNKQRLIPIGDNLICSLRRYVEEGAAFRASSLDSSLVSLKSSSDVARPLFVTDKGLRVYSGWVYRLVRKKLSQVVTLKKRSPHVLRHTFATVMLNNAAELEAVKELMGHESVSTTQIYTHTTFEELKKAYSKAHPRASINQ